MISSGVYRFLGMTMTSLVAVQSSIHPGPNLPGQVTSLVGSRLALAPSGTPVVVETKATGRASLSTGYQRADRQRLVMMVDNFSGKE